MGGTLKVAWEPPLETMWGIPLEGQNAMKCHAWYKMPHIAQSTTCKGYVFFESDRKRWWWICFTIFSKDYDISSICIIYKYVCIFVWEKLFFLLSLLLIIVHCDSVFKNQDWFMMMRRRLELRMVAGLAKNLNSSTVI